MDELWEILVPAYTPEGEKISVEFHQEWDREVRELSGGLTVMKTARGQWLNADAELFAEPMIPVRVMATREQVDQLIDLTLSYYRQQAVMAYRISDCVIVRHAEA